MRKRAINLAAAFLTAAFLAACGGNSGLSSSTPTSVTPQIAAPQSGTGFMSHRLEQLFGGQPHTSGTERVVYSFKGGTGGELPDGGLTNVGGKLYGTTNFGGTSGCGGNNGLSSTFPGMAAPQRAAPLLARQSRAGAGYKSLFSFGYSTGLQPRAALIAVGSELYGTTADGSAYGSGGYGTVFEVSASGKERILYSFGGGYDAAYPLAGLVAVGSELYGTTSQGGAHGYVDGGYGTVFEVSTSGKERVLYSFKAGKDGRGPVAGLIAIGSELYGTTEQGGSYACTDGCGTVFAVSTSGKERVLYRFQGGKDGWYPQAGLIAVGNELYGTTFYGGASAEYGTVFAVSTSGKERVLYRFQGGTDGASPQAGLIAVKHELYGTTYDGGANNSGTVFAVSTSGKERVMHSFTCYFRSTGCADGSYPQAGLIAVGNELYGTTFDGGAYGEGGLGTIFEVSTSGKERVLHSFGNGSDGAYPWAALVAAGSELYGTTQFGGTVGEGTVFKVSP